MDMQEQALQVSALRSESKSQNEPDMEKANRTSSSILPFTNPPVNHLETGNVHLSSFSDYTGHWERQERDYSHSVRFKFQSQPLSSSSTRTKHIMCHKIPRLLSSFEASQTLRCVFALKNEIVSNPKWKWRNGKWQIWMQNKSNILPLNELNISLEAI